MLGNKGLAGGFDFQKIYLNNTSGVNASGTKFVKILKITYFFEVIGNF